MPDITKRILEYGDGALLPDERLVAACLAQPKGTARRQLTGGVVGAIGGLKSARRAATDPTDCIAHRFPSRRIAIAVTDRRLLVYGQDTRSRPRDLLLSLPLADVATATLGSALMTLPLTLGFVDGSTIDLEAGRATGAADVVEAITDRA